MTRKPPGFYWHDRTSRLMGYCTNPTRREHYIQACQDPTMAVYLKIRPKHEALELMRIFKPVKGKLPDEIISASKTYNLDTLYQINWLIYNHKAEIEALHKVECPNCGWNGKELVFKETENENDRNIR